jgi:hypothetical protein
MIEQVSLLSKDKQKLPVCGGHPGYAYEGEKC